MKEITEAIKQQLNQNHGDFLPRIEKFTSRQPDKTMFNYFDGWYKSIYYKSEKATVEFCFYRSGAELNAYKDDESEWMEIDEGRSYSCIERFGRREEVESKIKDEQIKEVFSWLGYFQPIETRLTFEGY